MALGALRQRQRPAVQHDRAGAAHRRVDQRRQPAARRGHARDVGADLAGRAGRRTSGPRDHQRHPRADVAVVRDGAAVRRPPRRRTGATGTTTRRSGTRILDIPDEELWAARQALRNYLFAFIRERARSRWKEEHVSAAARRRRRHAARSERAHDRFRAALHRLQAAGADLPRPRTAARHPERVAPAGADRVRRQGAPGRRNRQASPAAGLSPRASTRSSAAASPSSTTTTCTSRTSSCRAATSG